MKKILLLFLIVFALFLAGCAQKNDNAYCEKLTNYECMNEQSCELCGESMASSFMSCHSKEFCKNIPPVKDMPSSPPATQNEDEYNITPELEKLTEATATPATTTDESNQAAATDETDQDTTTDEITGPTNDDTFQNQVSELGIDDFIKEMKKNETLRNYLKNVCLEGETRCPDGIYYQWTKANEIYAIAFISNRAEQAEKDDAFKYSTEIFKVNLKTGEVQRQSQHEGSFNFVLNLYQK